MQSRIKINDLDQLPDGFLLWDRVYQGQEGAILIIVTRNAHNVIIGSDNNHWPWWFIPMDIIEPLVSIFESEGLELSTG
jgi:hypothetical protein